MNDPLSNTLRKLIKQRDDALDVANDLLAALKYSRRFLRGIDHDVDYVDAAIAKAEAAQTDRLVGEHVETGATEGSANAD